MDLRHGLGLQGQRDWGLRPAFGLTSRRCLNAFIYDDYDGLVWVRVKIRLGRGRIFTVSNCGVCTWEKVDVLILVTYDSMIL